MRKTCKRLALLLLLVTPTVWAQFSQVISIGDSLSDTGNTLDASFGIQPPSPNFMGRFSNGPVWNELLAFELGLAPPTPSRDGGNNYGYGGALTSADVNITIIPFILVITLRSASNQIFDYLNDVGTGDPDALYTLGIGGNDILEAGEALSVSATPTQIDDAAQELYNIAQSFQVPLQQLLANVPSTGIARFAILNVPNVGATPRASNDGKEAIFEALTVAYNSGIADVVSSINDPRVILVDFFSLTNDAVANPASYGFTNVTDRCWIESPASVCSNPDEYLFWDDIHPTTVGHTMAMVAVQEAIFPPRIVIPLPAVYGWLLLAMLALIVGARPRN